MEISALMLMLQYCTSANQASISNVGLQADCRGWRGGGAFVLQKCSLARQYYACGYPKVAVVGLERAWGSTKSSTYCSLPVTVKNDILRLASLIVPNWPVLCILSQSPSSLCLLEFFALGFSAEAVFFSPAELGFRSSTVSDQVNGSRLGLFDFGERVIAVSDSRHLWS